MKLFSTLLLINTYFSGVAQNFNVKDFVNKEWAVSYKDSSFYLSDSLTFIFNNEGEQINFDSIFSSNDYLILEFKKGGKLGFEVHRPRQMSVFVPRAKFEWKFNKKNQCLRIFRSDSLIVCLTPTQKIEKDVTSVFRWSSTIQTLYVLFKRGCKARIVQENSN
jgi:hypothetical protein